MPGDWKNYHNCQFVPRGDRRFQTHYEAVMNFRYGSRRRTGFVVCSTADEFTYPPGTQLLLWDDIDQSAESLQEAKENRYRRAYGGNII